jgi:hypothetical protein
MRLWTLRHLLETVWHWRQNRRSLIAMITYAMSGHNVRHQPQRVAYDSPIDPAGAVVAEQDA